MSFLIEFCDTKIPETTKVAKVGRTAYQSF
jgi:hypothetical protein